MASALADAIKALSKQDSKGRR
ncbi:MAG: hypothetical protein K0Q68_3206, partial [Moraxellaceae bacterium]|nr:hypothetical protein [Moraxellaceae bacterium]